MSSEVYNYSYSDIKNSFIEYFRRNNHTIIEGSGIVPNNDPTLLFINSGMAPIKKYFLGTETPPAKRLANSQLCIRTNDIDSVGDETHGTSFTMLGNWSFDDYGREGAIDLSLGLLNKVFNIPNDRLSATILGPNNIGIPEDTIARNALKKYFNEPQIIPAPTEDNFWGPAGANGPCGPCTEIMYDRSPQQPIEMVNGHIKLIDQRHVEIWNAGVFMEYNKTTDGKIEPLNRTQVDAGAGLERLAMVLQNVESIHQINQYKPAYEFIKNYFKKDTETRIVFDHLKTAKLIIESGVMPNKDSAGSVARRLIRRSLGLMAVNGLMLESSKNIFDAIVSVADPTPKQKVSSSDTSNVIKSETEIFSRLLADSLIRIEKTSENGYLDPKQIFNLQTSHGVPLDLIKSYMNYHGHIFPVEQYSVLMSEHQKLSRNGGQ